MADYALKIKRECAVGLARMVYGDEFDDQAGEIHYKFTKSRIKMQSSGTKNIASITQVIREMNFELWNPEFPVQLNTLWKPVLKSIPRKYLPTTLLNALQTNNGWDTEFQSLLQIQGSKSSHTTNKGILKCVYLNYITRITMVVHTWQTLFGEYHPKIKIQLQKDKTWSDESRLILFLFLIECWPMLMSFHWKPRKYLEIRALRTAELLGFSSLLLGWCLVAAETSTDRFKNKQTLIKSIIDVEKYGFRSRLDKIELPKWFDHDEIKELLWNYHNDNKHLTMQNNISAIPFAYTIVEKHKKFCMSRFGKATFIGHAGLDSDISRNRTIEGGPQRLILTWNDDVLNDEKNMTLIKNSLNHKLQCKFDYTPEKPLLGISQYIRELGDTGMCF